MFFNLSAAIGKILSLKRQCPKCKKGQITPSEKINQMVMCKFCGAKIPPAIQEN